LLHTEHLNTKQQDQALEEDIRLIKLNQVTKSNQMATESLVSLNCFNFQDFPGPNSFSRTFQVLENLEKIQDFPGGVGTLDMW